MRSDPAHRYENYGSGLPAPAPALAMLSVMIAVGMASLDTAIANTALPTMAKQLSTSPVASLWIVNSYQLAMVATLLSFAALGEIGGYRRVFIVGLALFTAASLGCALALSLPALIVARLVQGIGASAVMSVATALMRIIYPPHLHGRAFGINALVVAMAFAVGPTVASLILAVLSWPWLFAINVPVGIVAWSLARRVLPETVPNSQSFDQLAALYSIGAFGSLILLFGDAAHAAGPQRWGGELICTLSCFCLLLRKQRGHPSPLLPTDLFLNPLFTLSALTSVCTFAVQGLCFVSLPFYFESIGKSPIDTGFLITPWPVMVAVMAPVAGWLSDRHSSAVLGGIGLIALCAGIVTLLALPAVPSDPQIAWRIGLCGIGFGFFQAPNMKAIMNSAPPARAGGASGIVATARLIGQASGVALVACCFMLAGSTGPTCSLMIAAGVAALGAGTSLARLLIRSRN